MGRDKDGDKPNPQIPEGVRRADLTQPSLNLLVKVRSAQYLHLVQNAGTTWSNTAEYFQQWSLFGEPLTEKECAQLVTQMPEVLDSLRPRVSKEVHQSVADFMQRNWDKLGRYGSGYVTPPKGPEAGTKGEMELLRSTTLVDLLSLKDAAQIAVNTATAVRIAFMMEHKHAEMLWQIQSTHRLGAHPLYLSVAMSKHVNSYDKDRRVVDASVSVGVWLYTLMEEPREPESEGHGSYLYSIEGITWFDADETRKTYEHLKDLRLGSTDRRARAVWMASASHDQEANALQLEGNKDSIEPFVEMLLVGPPISQRAKTAHHPQGLLPRANSKNAVSDE